MSEPVASLIESVLARPAMSVQDAGREILGILSDGELSPDAFRDDPHRLMGPDHGVSRYLAQVIWRALAEDYETLDEVVAGLYGILDRNPPTLESRDPGHATDEGKFVVPEARILSIEKPVRLDDGWEAAFEAQVTSGPLHDTEIEVRVRSDVNPKACFITSYLWVHATVAMYNLEGTAPAKFEARNDTFFVLEPLRQVNATSIARSMNCPKPQIDQIRQGRGDLTVHTLKGMIVHAILDRIIEGEDDVQGSYEAVVPGYRSQMAALADALFDEGEFRAEALRHAQTLKEFVDLNPHMRIDPQVELHRYSATLGIQGRIDAVFKNQDRLDVVELKTGKRIRAEDHAQLFIYRLLLSDMIRRTRLLAGRPIELTSRLLSSVDGMSTPLRSDVGFLDVMDVRNRLVALSYSLGRAKRHVAMPYVDYDADICGACPPWTFKRCKEASATYGDMPDADEGADLAFFRKFSTLVQREKWSVDRDLGDLLDDSRLGYRVRNFRTICDAHCVGQQDGQFVFRFEENRSDLGAGDRVLIHGGRISSSTSYHGYIRSVEGTRARVTIPLKNLTADTFGDASWTIDRLPSDRTSVASQTALSDFLDSPSDARKRVILGELGARYPDSERGAPASIDDNARLNPSQREAVQRAVAADVFHLIWGPPGTGKTVVVPEIVRNAGGPVLLGAFTNTAVDKMLGSMLDADPDVRFLRFGRSKDSPELAARLGERAGDYFSEDLAASVPTASELRVRFDETTIVAATAHRASAHPYLRGRSFEMTIVDEAGQLTEPLTLGLVMRARRFVLIGDDRQLPPVVRIDALAASTFERLKSVAATDAPDSLTLLNVQYRMHPEIMDVSNRLYYDGLLSAGVNAEDRTPPSGAPLVFVPVESDEEGRSNLDEAKRVVEIVESLVAEVGPDNIGVISPFRAQVVLLRRLLEGTGVGADTVERFQGGERDVIIMSFVRSRGTNFVFDDRRFNVAITRARRKLVMVAHPELFRNTKYQWITEAPPL